MSNQVKVSALKKQLEDLFPGKWLSSQFQTKALWTGLSSIDGNLVRGLSRQRITEWTGPISSGKTTILRTAIANWITSGLHVAYIDTSHKLRARDWTFPSTQLQLLSSASNPGRFWVIRPTLKTEKSNTSTHSKNSRSKEILRDAIWAADQLIRCQSFDVVVLDLDLAYTGRGRFSNYELPLQNDRLYARLQTSLAQSNTSLLVVKTTIAKPSSLEPGWGCQNKLNFNWLHNPKYQSGFGGISIISPTAACSIWKGGTTKTVEVSTTNHGSNRLFTHSSVPDRRTSKP